MRGNLVNDEPSVRVLGDRDPECADRAEHMWHKAIGHSFHHFEASHNIIAVSSDLQVIGCSPNLIHRQYLYSGVGQPVLWMFRIGCADEIPVERESLG